MNHEDKGTESNLQSSPVELPAIRAPLYSRPACDYHDVSRASKGSGFPMEALKYYAGVIVRRKLQVLLTFAAVMLLGMAYTLVSKPVYRSYATLDIEGEHKQTVVIDAAVSAADKDYYATQVSILKNRALSQKLAEQMNLAQYPEFQFGEELPDKALNHLKHWIGISGADMDPEERVTRHENALVESVMSRIYVEAQSRGRLATVSLEAENPRLAHQMLKQYIEIFLEYNLNRRRSDSLESSYWLKKELGVVEKELTRSREALVNFTNKHGIVSLQKDMNHVLTEFNVAAEALLKSKENRFKVQAFQQRPNKGVQGVPQAANAEHLVKLKESLAALEAEDSQMSVVYSRDSLKSVMLKEKIKQMRQKIAEVETSTISAAVDTAVQEESFLQQNFEKAKQAAMKLNSLGIQHAILQKEVDTNEQVYQMFLQRAKEMDVQAGVTGNNISLILPPVLSFDPVKPRKPGYLLLAGFLGLVLGVLGAFFREFRDQSIKDLEDFRTHLNIPSLGVLPDLNKVKSHDRSVSCNLELLPHHQPRSPVHDALRNIYASISFSSLSKGRMKTLAFTSAEPEEGKTFLAVSLATVICADGLDVLIIDCDLRCPKIHQVFQIRSTDKGLSTFLDKGKKKLDDIIRQTDVPGVNVITSGPTAKNPVGLLQSPRMMELLQECRERYDLVLLDCPPILGFADSRVLAANAEGVILVVREARVSRHILKEAISLLPRDNMIGGILNMTGDKYTRHYYNRAEKYYKRS